jgi:hypothetical protein
MKSININGITIRYNAKMLPHPPTLNYKADNLAQLLKDWEDSAFISVDGVGIPICFWRKMYSWTRPKAWKSLKDQWTKYRFIVQAIKFYAYGDVEAFFQFATLGTEEGSLGLEKLTMTGISDALRKQRNARDKTDAESARNEFDGEEFARVFSYKKGGQRCVMKREQDIARCYRKANGIRVYWDEEEEAISEEDE